MLSLNSLTKVGLLIFYFPLLFACTTSASIEPTDKKLIAADSSVLTNGTKKIYLVIDCLIPQSSKDKFIFDKVYNEEQCIDFSNTVSNYLSGVGEKNVERLVFSSGLELRRDIQAIDPETSNDKNSVSFPIFYENTKLTDSQLDIFRKISSGIDFRGDDFNINWSGSGGISSWLKSNYQSDFSVLNLEPNAIVVFARLGGVQVPFGKTATESFATALLTMGTISVYSISSHVYVIVVTDSAGDYKLGYRYRTGQYEKVDRNSEPFVKLLLDDIPFSQTHQPGTFYIPPLSSLTDEIPEGKTRLYIERPKNVSSTRQDIKRRNNSVSIFLDGKPVVNLNQEKYLIIEPDNGEYLLEIVTSGKKVNKVSKHNLLLEGGVLFYEVKFSARLDILSEIPQPIGYDNLLERNKKK